MHRNQVVRLYKFDLQPILNTYSPYMDILKKNSTKRIEQSKNYQNFLKELSNTDAISETAENYELSDLQLTEASNILKDLIFLSQERKVTENSTEPPAAA